MKQQYLILLVGEEEIEVFLLQRAETRAEISEKLAHFLRRLGHAHLQPQRGVRGKSQQISFLHQSEQSEL